MRAMAISLALLLSLAVGTVAAQQSESREAPSEESARALIQDMQEIQQQLIGVQEQALRNHPELQEQAQQYQQTLLEAMRSEGFDPMQSLSHIELIQNQIQSQDLNEEERIGLMAEVQEEEERLQRAEEAALGQAEVQQARAQLMEGMLGAMREEEPRTDQLIQDLERKNEELREMMTAAAPAQ